LRQKAADSLETLGKQTEEVLDHAKPQIASTLRAGQEKIRPTQCTPGQESYRRAG
jgi:hypothetical protein